MRRPRGFSLVELLIVVAIILIIAAIAMPSLVRAHIAANESATVSALRTINTAEISYNSAYPSVGFASTLAALGPPSSSSCPTPNSTNACLIDYPLAVANAAPGRSGYFFDLATFTGGTGYATAAAAIQWNQSGVRSFCSTGDGVVRYKVETATVPPSTYTSSIAACTALTSLK